MRVLVVGAGAIGGYFGAILARAGHDVTMVARGAHLETIRARGVEIVEGPDQGLVPVQVVADPKEAEDPELVLFAVKTYDTEEAYRSLYPALAAHTLILELQNGVGRAEEIGRLVGAGRVLAGVVYMETEREAPGIIRYLSGARRIVFGEPRGRITPRVARLKDQLQAAGINAEASDDMPSEEWQKFVLVCAANALTAMTGLPFGEIFSFPGGGRVVADVIAEAVAVGQAAGVDLGPDVVEQSVGFLETLGPRLRSSMLRDIQAGRRVEVEALNGHVVREGDRLGVPVPLNRLIWLALALHHTRVEKGSMHEVPTARAGDG